MVNIRSLGNTKSSLFSTISFATILFLILLTISVFSNFFLQSIYKEETRVSLTHKSHFQFRSSSLPTLSYSVEEKITEAYNINRDSLIPPINATEQERIAWFKEKLRAFDVFKSTKLTSQFAERARKFLDNTCEVQFFMTWISPARSLRQREILVLESVFKAHPHGCLMILSSTMDSIHGNRILKPLQDLGFRVIAVKPDLSFLLKNTPAEAWFRQMKKGNKDPGEIPLAQNLSNLLRLAVLYKYGGAYLDIDFIVIKKLSGLRNSIGAQSMDAETGKWSRLNNAVLIFDKNHPLLFKFIEEFSLTFDGNKWGHNGPYLVSRVIERVRRRPHYNFTVLPSMAFYPVHWNRITGFFQKPVDPAMSRWVSAKLLQLSEETYGVHLWNRQSSDLRIGEGSIIGRLISDHCVLCEDIYNA
ncbi:lactosylceramide 4-alpha-galactosyltransferase-like [Telopea speciosissima]|uniref:lactosylceramide 4-alpha-galactosyltransferase-like n=1 Tax=Telopea speciosissima TaxID=54955 RepID=UPI001CC34CC4|nr:lactosylceramide 4-alpha-galactosyltransferase-like [Telopea speciosissima]